MARQDITVVEAAGPGSAEVQPADQITSLPTPHLQRASNEGQVTNGQPTEQLEIEEPNEDNVEFPQGSQLWLNMVSIVVVSFLHGLDLTIVAVVIPRLTDEFKTLNDIGWYSAVYGLVISAMCFTWAKLYTLFPLKKLYMISVAIFEFGSLLCTVAPSSHAFILGRAVAGFGIAGQGAGAKVMIPRCFPNSKRPIVTGVIGFAQSVGLVSAPIIGGALTDALSWRACFGINIPLGIIAIIITFFCMVDPVPNPNIQLPLKAKLKQLDLFGTALIVPAIVCLMLGLQWGGLRYGWNNWRIILVLVLFAGLVALFGYLQYHLQDNAVLPPRIIKNRTILASTLYICCANGLLAVTEYYIAIYFQGVRGLSAAKAGMLGVPMVAGLAVSSVLGALGTTWIGYYSPFLFFGGVVTPIASGILTTIDLTSHTWKVAALLGFVGFAIGPGLQAPVIAVMTVTPLKDISVAMGALTFGAGMGAALFVAASAALFQSRLETELHDRLPGFNTTSIEKVGLSDLRQVIGQEKLTLALSGYNEAVVQTLYLPLALGLLCLLGAFFTEHKPIKKKTA